MAINWFPGHMNRARREIADAIRKVDVVIELVDGRLPLSSRNPMLGEFAEGKPILTLFTKSDLADPEVTDAWIEAWQGPRPLALVMTDAKSVRTVPKRCRELAPNRGGPGRTVRTLVVGIPNVGKSTMINTLIGRRIAKVGDRPAVTRRAQRVELEGDFSIFDSPGVLWPKLDDQDGARRLAASGAIGGNAFEPIDIAGWAACFVAERYSSAFEARYEPDEPIAEIFEQTSPDPKDASRAVALLEAIGRRRGALRSGGHIDLDRAADIFLRDLRAGKITLISFETPADHPDLFSETTPPAQADQADQEKQPEQPAQPQSPPPESSPLD